MKNTYYTAGSTDALALEPGARRFLLGASLTTLVGRFTSPTILRRYFAGLRDAAVEAELTNPSPSKVEDRTKLNKQTPTNTNMETLVMAFVNALLAIAAAINNLAAAQGGTPSNVIAGPGATAGTPAAGAKPAGGFNTAGLEKARAAAAAKKEAERLAKEQAASDQADLDLLGGGGGGGGVTLEMLRNKGMEILKAKKQPQMKTLLDGLGAASITTLAEDKYQEAYEGLEAILSL